MIPICPECSRKIPLLKKGKTGVYKCVCGNQIPYMQGIYKFVQQNDPFYEGKFTYRGDYDVFSKKFIMHLLGYVSLDGNEIRIQRKATKIIRRGTYNKRLAILNIGAGGGHTFLKNLGIISAVDISFTSLLNAQEVSDYCYQADCNKLPFDDESFDLTFSSHVLGHIPLEQKQNVINEIYRVTKKGGFSLHSAECEANNFVYRLAKKYPDLYKKYFQDQEGHYGIELPTKCKKRFHEAGFSPIFEFSDYNRGIIRPAHSYNFWFGKKEFYEKELVFRILVYLSRGMSFNIFERGMFGILLYPLTPLNRIYGPDGVDSIKVLYKR